MKLLLEIKEDKFPFVMELLGNFKFVRMKDVSTFTPQILGDTDKGTEASKPIKGSGHGKLKSVL